MVDSLCRGIRGRDNIHSLVTARLSQRGFTGILEKIVDSEVAWSGVSTRALLLTPNGQRDSSRLLSVHGAIYVRRAREGSPMDRLLADVDVIRQVPGWSLDG